jgi:hypothetical protein
MEPNRQFMLPVSVVSPTDVARLKREVDAIDNFFRQSEIRAGGEPSATMPQLSKLMDQVVSANQLNLLQEADRQWIVDSLTSLDVKAPVMHISFSVDPPGSHVQKIVAWLRENIDPAVLVTVGLQPNIGAGCVVRTTNKIFDMSLREFFASKRSFFVDKLHQVIADPKVLEGEQEETTQNPQTQAEGSPA